VTVRVVQSVAELDAASGVLGFVAQGCAPCLQQRPIWEALDVEVLVVDVDSLPELKTRFGVEALPTTVVLAGGEVQERLRGVRTTRQILEALGISVIP
jgi:thioredoxin 1